MKIAWNGRIVFAILLCLGWHIISISSLYSGAWCPYQVNKLVPCRVKNGTEMYYGPNMCWRNVNGSYACSKKILYRPRYATTFKKVLETKYKCCPGMEGPDCQNECFNCSTYLDAIQRLDKMEKFVSNLAKNNHDRYNLPFSTYQTPVKGLADKENTIGLSNEQLIDSSIRFVGLNSRISTLLNEIRDLESKVDYLEAELNLLKHNFEDLIRKEQVASRDESLMEPLTLNPISTNRSPHKNVDTVDTEDNKGHHHPPAPISSSTSAISLPNQQRLEGEKLIVRPLEDNLERGDIASTLNDDYGEELLFDNSTEQYNDPLLN